MSKLNIAYDFSRAQEVTNQELAIMPASLAKKLLQDYTSRLTGAYWTDIIQDHQRELGNCDSLEQAIQVSIDWVNTRSLIETCAKGDFDKYRVEMEEERPRVA